MTMSVGAGEGRRMTSPTPISRCEFGVLLLICLLGFGFRAWDVSSVGIDHFDEGVYALSGLSLIEPEWDLYFKQTEFSPPLFFTLVGLSYRMAGQPSGEAAIAVNVVLGALTIPLLWWVGRIWFGAPAGIFAAALLAFSEYHITLSRTALTDVAFAFFLLLALAAIVAALKRRGVGLSLLAGVAVGLAWNTKYHGWLAVVMTGIALVAVTIREPIRWPTVKRSSFLWSVIVVVAVACYLPWAAFVQAQPGGYLGVVENHRSLLSLHWPQNFWVHAQDQFFLDGPLMPLFDYCRLLLSAADFRSIPTTHGQGLGSRWIPGYFRPIAGWLGISLRTSVAGCSRAARQPSLACGWDAGGLAGTVVTPNPFLSSVCPAFAPFYDRDLSRRRCVGVAGY